MARDIHDIERDLERTVLVVSSKSGSTVETDSQRRVMEAAFREAGIAPQRVRLINGSALDVLPRLTDGHYDLVFCDPPTFSNSARADDFDIQREHVRLLKAAVARLSLDGVLYFSNNFRRFRLDVDAIAAFADCEEISAGTIPPDFARNPRIHRAWRLQRRR